MKISILIGTRNRASALRETLEALFQQQHLSYFDFEVIVVNNDSPDNTRQVVEDFEAQYPEHLIYLEEKTLGASSARNAGLRVASGDVIAIVDDDVLVEKNWLAEIHREFAEDESLGLMAGRVLLARTELQPVAIQESTEPRIMNTPEQAVESACIIVGANTAFRREVFEQCGDYDVRLGPGRFFAGCDDLDLVCRAMKAGYRMKYAPNVVVYHNHDRVSRKQACHLQYNYGKGYAGYLVKHLFAGDKHALRVTYWSLYGYIKRILNRSADRLYAADFARELLRGMIIAFVPAVLRMWREYKGHRIAVRKEIVDIPLLQSRKTEYRKAQIG
ncbi:MAG TPA: glycosyltransferase [Blastocatellia bacterium]|nr:glycosyltransferase [Blastocatellia bacterium]